MAPLRTQDASPIKAPVVAIVGVDGCGKSSTFRGLATELAGRLRVVGIGDQILGGGPGAALGELQTIPFSHTARIAGGVAKNLRWQRLYKNLKFGELAERARICNYVATHDPPDVVLTDGHPLINCAAWAAARFYRDELTSDEALFRALRYMAGEVRIPVRELPHYLRRAFQIVLLNFLWRGRFKLPDLVCLLEVDSAIAMARIRARGQPLQAHETESFLAQLGCTYERVCRLVQERQGVPVTRVRVDTMTVEETVRRVKDFVLEYLNEAE